MADYPYRISYGSVLSQIEAYYGQGSPVWDSFVADSSTGFSSANYGYLEQIGINPILAQDGSVLGYYQTAPMPSHSGSTYEVVNSNVQGAKYSGNATAVKVNGTATQTQSGGKTKTTFNSGAKTVSTGSRVMTVLSEASGYVFGARVGGWLGLQFSQALYDSGVSWAWSKDDWAHFIQNDADSLDKAVFSFLTGIDANGNSTMYADEEALAQYYMMLRDMGIYTSGSISYGDVIPVGGSFNPTEKFITGTVESLTTMYMPEFFTQANTSAKASYNSYKNAPAILCGKQGKSGDITSLSLLMATDGIVINDITVNVKSVSGDGMTVDQDMYSTSGTIRVMRKSTANSWGFASGAAPGKKAVTVEKGNSPIINIKFVSDVDGIEDDPNANTYIDPSLIDGQDRDTVLQQLKQNYPELFDGEIYQDVPQQDGTVDRKKYVPVPYVAPSSKPVTGTNHQNNPSVNPETNPQTDLDTLVELITQLLTPTDIPDTGDGETPPTVIPVGSASSLWKIYNPTQAQVDAFGSWLWDSSFVEQIKKLFNDPMQAIIGIHKVFATPSTGGTATIKVGYLDSQVSSAWVDNQYTTVNCGSASLKEYFGNVFDYAPYTKVQLYLPFIGIVDLDVGDVMRSTISVVYHVDVLTGACLADVKVNRDGAGGVLYQYAGSAIVTYPVSAGNYMGMLAGVVSVAGGIAGTILSGGALAPALIGGAVGASHLHTDVSHSGGFSGCAGAMGSKKPYLIVSRPQIAMADNYQHYTGIPANSKVTLGSCSGYAKVKSVYVNSITRATEEEKNMIEAQLKAGVLV